MRTTVTLDPDVERLLRESMAKHQCGFKAALNEALRRGLRDAPAKPLPPFTLKAKAMHLRAGLDPLRLQKLDSDLEVAAFLETTQRLSKDGL